MESLTKTDSFSSSLTKLLGFLTKRRRKNRAPQIWPDVTQMHMILKKPNGFNRKESPKQMIFQRPTKPTTKGATKNWWRSRTHHKRGNQNLMKIQNPPRKGQPKTVENHNQDHNFQMRPPAGLSKGCIQAVQTLLKEQGCVYSHRLLPKARIIARLCFLCI